MDYKFIEINKDTYQVPNGKGIVYGIKRAVYGGHWVCNCKAFMYRKVDKDCKHIQALKDYLGG